ncbi:hypothetical protein EV421DRAFT_1909148 [Armillaria borealis]|uniref:Uncharacterized protein n=1 Tax=Armillaria borealis TaxID=47425 RepID=A0AA39J5T4_9AGAR|nr:hypothetical protein EV421DRAFT_1909148 [Armillaria borealis]
MFYNPSQQDLTSRDLERLTQFVQDYQEAQIRDILDPGFLHGWLNKLAEYWMFRSHIVNNGVFGNRGDSEHRVAITRLRKILHAALIWASSQAQADDISSRNTHSTRECPFPPPPPPSTPIPRFREQTNTIHSSG